MTLEEIIINWFPFIFAFILGVLAGLPAMYAAIRKLLKDWSEAYEDGEITADEFKLLIDDLIDVISKLRSGFDWIIAKIKGE